MQPDDDQPGIQARSDNESPEPEEESKYPSDSEESRGGDEGSPGWRTPQDEFPPEAEPGRSVDPPLPGDEGSRGW